MARTAGEAGDAGNADMPGRGDTRWPSGRTTTAVIPDRGPRESLEKRDLRGRRNASVCVMACQIVQDAREPSGSRQRRGSVGTAQEATHRTAK